MFIVDLLHRLQVAHESRQVLEVAPEAVHLFARLVNCDRAIDANAELVGYARTAALAARVGSDAQSLVQGAVAGCGAIGQRAAERGQRRTAPGPLLQPIGDENSP